MAYLDSTIPAETEAVKRGAFRIRELKDALTTLIEKIFDEAGEFLDGWVTVDMLSSLSVSSAKLIDEAVTTGKLADGVLSADATGRAKMADGFITATKLVSGIQLPTDSVPAAAIKANAVTAAKIPDGEITVNKLALAGLRFVSSQVTVASGLLVNEAHGLSFTPRVQAVLVCKADDNGFVVDDEVSVSPIERDTSETWMYAGADSVKVWVVCKSQGGALRIPNKTTGTLTDLTGFTDGTKWKIKVVAGL